MAGTATSNLTVSSDVVDNCTISTAAISFGDYDALSANPLDQTGSVTITCTTGAAATIKLGQGSNATAGSTDSAPQRRLTNGSSGFLSYQIYQDGARSTVWGNTAGSGVSETGNGAAQVKTVYGRIPPGQNLPTGAYSDTVVAEVAF
jgi:spore coat protein U-like protein